MSIKVSGMEKLTKDLEGRFGKMKMQALTDQAIKAGAAVFVKELKIEFEKFKDTGASLKEMTLTEPYNLAGVRTISVKWEGPKKRYAVIHLNEFGTVKNPNPPGKGAIARALQNAEKAYRKTVRDTLRRGI